VKPANDAREAPAASSLAAQLNPSEQTVARVIAESELDAEGVVERTGLDAGAVLSSLTSLELKGVVRRLPSGRFVARTLPVAAGD
jgi:predicted Rossmann fold nucleotide-binding protein DprA/Smf involved in DNA uptake